MENKILTESGYKTPEQIFDALIYGSYKANRDLGVKHESLISIGIGNDEMLRKYEKEKETK